MGWGGEVGESDLILSGPPLHLRVKLLVDSLPLTDAPTISMGVCLKAGSVEGYNSLPGKLHVSTYSSPLLFAFSQASLID